MKFLVLLICLGYAMANDQLMDELDKILAGKSESADPSADTDELIKQLVESLDGEKSDSSPHQDEGMPSQYDDKLSDYDDPLYKRMSAPKRPKYGYCMDGATPADGPNDQGCARKLCYDERVTECNEIFADELKLRNSVYRNKAIKRKCSLGYHRLRTLCPNTCGYCKSQSPQKTCEKRYKTRYGCCKIGGIPSLKADHSDCPPCKDLYPHVCGQFMANRLGITCNSNSYRIRTFLNRRCAVSCGICRRGEL